MKKYIIYDTNKTIKPLSTIEKKIIDDFLKEGKRLPLELEHLSAGMVIRLLRRRLFLTQVQLAKRIGIPQPTLQRIESGKTRPHESLLRKIFDAMECDFLVVPIPKRFPDEILKEKAREIAKKRVNSLKGTMALKKQKPEEKWLEELLEQEIEEIFRNPSKIWDEYGR